MFRTRGPLIFRRGVKTPTIDWQPVRASVGDVGDAALREKSPVFRKVLFTLMVAMPVISFGLGCWQVKRLNWKVNLISKCEKMLAKEPLSALPADIDPEVVGEFEYRRFKIKGHFDYSQEMFLGPRIKNGMVGYLLVCPFIRKDGGKPILVERGWISKEKVVPETRENGYLSYLARPQGEVEIEAFFRSMPKKSSLQFDHDEDTRLFLIPDVESMAKQSGALPVYCQMTYDMSDHPQYKQQRKGWGLFKKNEKEERDFEMDFQEFEFVKQGVPIGTIPKVNFSNNHLQYLITWFGLSLASSVALAYSLLKRKKFSSAEKIIEAKRQDMKKNW